MEIQVHEDPQQVARSTARLIAQLASGNKDPDRGFSLALSGGSTPAPLYKLLSGVEAPQIDWSQVHFFWGDERCVDPDHPESNYGMAKKLLLDRIAPPVKNIHRIRGELAPSEAAAEYIRELQRHFQIAENEMPRFDLILLGLGGDGHTASLFPGNIALDEVEKPVATVETGDRKTKRITLTLPAINNARYVVFLVTGSAKAEMLKKVLKSRQGDVGLPASLVRPKGQLLIIADLEAAGLAAEEKAR